MQKKLIALAIAGLSSAAFAQSNVTIYGVADASFENVRASGANANAAVGNTAVDIASRARTQTNSSYIGFKGAESLGNGLTAVFQFESGVNLDGGAANANTTQINGGNLFGGQRDTMIALAGSFGTVAMGYLSSPYRSTAASFDVMPGATGAGSAFNLIGNINIGALTNPLSATGLNTGSVMGSAPTTTVGTTVINDRVGIVARHNAVAYITPTFNGFSGVIAYVPNESKDNGVLSSGTVNQTANRNPHAWNVAANYANGPLALSYTYLEIKDAGVINTLAAGGIFSGAEKHKSHLFGAKYTFNGATTVSAMYETFKGDVGFNGAGQAATLMSSLEAKRNVWWLGVKHVMGAHELAASYARASNMKSNVTANYLTAVTATGGSIGDSGATNWNLRYGYNFSKRTQVYGLYARINNKSNGNYDFNTYGGAVGTAGSTGGFVATAGSDPQVLGIGMRHSF